ncbi:OPA3-domain-containing protein, partial [Cutaneotrichosporon oleaginosum]
MASVKIFSLAVKTLAKPIASTIKQQAVTHDSFRRICVNFAQQLMHRTEARMRMGLLNEEAKNIKPLNEAKAVQNGASMMAESFLFALGASLVLGETYRSSRKNEKRRDQVTDRLEDLEAAVEKLNEHAAQDVRHLQERSEALERTLKTVVSNGLRAGWLSLGHHD